MGIVGDVKHLNLDEEGVPMFYTPQPQEPSFHTMTLVVRSTTPPDSLVSGVARELGSMDREIPLYSVRSLNEVLDRSVGEERFRARLRFFPLWQQAGAIGLLLLNDRIIGALVHWVVGAPQAAWTSWFSWMLAMVLWPWLYVFLDMARLRARERG